MRLNGKPVAHLSRDDITSLLDQTESNDLDCKVKGYEGGSGNAELAKDVVGMANASGGVILIGVEEKNEKIVGWPGISLENGGKDPIEKYQRSLRDRVEPPLVGLVFNAIDMGDDKYVIAIGIPASFARPHRTKISGEGSGRGRWTIRRGTDTVDMTYDEIRASFLGAGEFGLKVREFHRDRVTSVQRNWGTIQGYGGVMVLHVVPLGFGQGRLDVEEALKLRNFFQPPGETPGLVGLFADFDGVSGHVSMGPQGELFGWVQIYRNGIVEGVKGHYTGLNGQPGDQGRRFIFNHYQFERHVRDAVPYYINGLLSLGFNPPFAISLTLFNGPPATIDQIGNHPRQIMHPIATLEPGLIESTTADGMYDAELRPLFDQLWNAFGLPRSMSYDDDGIWRGVSGPVVMQWR